MEQDIQVVEEEVSEVPHHHHFLFHHTDILVLAIHTIQHHLEHLGGTCLFSIITITIMMKYLSIVLIPIIQNPLIQSVLESLLEYQ